MDLPCFKDAAGREWRFAPSLGLFDAIQEATGVDLIPDGNDVSAVMALPMNRRKLSDVLWATVEGKAKDAGVTREQFRDSINGDVLTEGWGALLDAIVFFTPTSTRAEVQAAIDVQVAAMERGVTAVVETLRSEETEAAISEALSKVTEEMRRDLPKALATGVMSLQAS